MEHMTSQQAHTILVGLFREHQLFGWRVKFGYAKRTAGSCHDAKKEITLSKYLMAQRSYEDTMMTITHEVAHALTPGHHHDHVWVLQHRALGGNGKRCFQHVDDKAPWVGECPHGQKFRRYRQPKRLEGWRCRCAGSGPVVWARNAA